MFILESLKSRESGPVDSCPYPAKKEYAGTLVEVAILFPLFLVIIFIFLFIGTAYNARASLTAAVGNIRLGFTRGNTALVGGTLIATVDNWKAAGRINSREELVATSDQLSSFQTKLDTDANTTFPGYRFTDLPSEYIYSHIYIYQSMLQSVGDVRFPCNPKVSTGSGCLQCRMKNPGTGNLSPGGPPPGAIGWDSSWIGIICEYRPSNTLLSPIQSILRLITGDTDVIDILITRQYEFWVPNP